MNSGLPTVVEKEFYNFYPGLALVCLEAPQWRVGYQVPRYAYITDPTAPLLLCVAPSTVPARHGSLELT